VESKKGSLVFVFLFMAQPGMIDQTLSQFAHVSRSYVAGAGQPGGGAASGSGRVEPERTEVAAAAQPPLRSNQGRPFIPRIHFNANMHVNARELFVGGNGMIPVRHGGTSVIVAPAVLANPQAVNAYYNVDERDASGNCQLFLASCEADITAAFRPEPVPTGTFGIFAGMSSAELAQLTELKTVCFDLFRRLAAGSASVAAAAMRIILADGESLQGVLLTLVAIDAAWEGHQLGATDSVEGVRCKLKAIGRWLDVVETMQQHAPRQLSMESREDFPNRGGGAGGRAPTSTPGGAGGAECMPYDKIAQSAVTDLEKHHKNGSFATLPFGLLPTLVKVMSKFSDKGQSAVSAMLSNITTALQERYGYDVGEPFIAALLSLYWPGGLMSMVTEAIDLGKCEAEMQMRHGFTFLARVEEVTSLHLFDHAADAVSRFEDAHLPSVPRGDRDWVTIREVMDMQLKVHGRRLIGAVHATEPPDQWPSLIEYGKQVVDAATQARVNMTALNASTLARMAQAQRAQVAAAVAAHLGALGESYQAQPALKRFHDQQGDGQEAAKAKRPLGGGDLTQQTVAPEAHGGRAASKCWPYMLGGQCATEGCRHAHVRAEPGDICPFRDSCRLKGNCPLASTHT